MQGFSASLFNFDFEISNFNESVSIPMKWDSLGGWTLAYRKARLIIAKRKVIKRS